MLQWCLVTNNKKINQNRIILLKQKADIFTDIILLSMVRTFILH